MHSSLCASMVLAAVHSTVVKSKMCTPQLYSLLHVQSHAAMALCRHSCLCMHLRVAVDMHISECSCIAFQGEAGPLEGCCLTHGTLLRSPTANRSMLSPAGACIHCLSAALLVCAATAHEHTPPCYINPCMPALALVWRIVTSVHAIIVHIKT